MSREVRRVPLDFDWPLEQVWAGYLMPASLHEKDCATCKGRGYSTYAQWLQARWYGYVTFRPYQTGSAPLTPRTPAVRAFAERNVVRSPGFYGVGEAVIVREATRLATLWNGMWCHHLTQADVDALIAADRLWDLTRTVTRDGWKRIEPTPVVTAAQVNLWSLQGFGHDAINCMVVVGAACKRAGKSDRCGDCEGHGSHERYPGQRAEAEAWEATAPPTGDGWQLWETTTEGSPISPVFATGEGLAVWMSENPCGFGRSRISLQVARQWLEGSGWAPSMIGTGDGRLLDGITAVAGGLS